MLVNDSLNWSQRRQASFRIKLHSNRGRGCQDMVVFGWILTISRLKTALVIQRNAISLAVLRQFRVTTGSVKRRAVLGKITTENCCGNTRQMVNIMIPANFIITATAETSTAQMLRYLCGANGCRTDVYLPSPCKILPYTCLIPGDFKLPYGRTMQILIL